DAIEKKSQLESSIVEAKKFIDGLDGSQNIPGIRMELTELQNGLKSNQALEYQGSSISAENTLEGRTEGMRIKGKTLVNLVINGSEEIVIDKSKGADTRIKQKFTHYDLTPGKAYVGYINVTKYEGNPRYGLRIYGMPTIGSNAYYTVANGVGWYKFRWQTQDTTAPFNRIGIYMDSGDFDNGGKITCDSFMLFEEGSEIEGINSYFEDIKSFGEAEQEGDKYKISILSCGKNLAKLNLNNKNITPFEDGYRLDCVALYRGDEDIFDLKGKYKENTQYVLSYYGKILDNSNANNYRIRVYYTDNTYTDGIVTGNKYEKRIIKTLSGKTVYKIIGYYGSMNGDFIVKDVMLEEGTQATQYEPYKCDKKDILIKEPLRSVSDVKDVMYEDNGQVKIDKYVKEYTFTGDEDITISVNKPSSGNYLRVFFQGLNNNLKQMQHGNLLCTTLPPKNLWNIPNEEGISITQGIDMQILKSKLTSPDVQGFKAWLKANPTTIVYQLATPTIEIVENCVDIDLDTYQEKTYFNILNSLPGSLDFKVPSNLGSSLQNLAKEVNNIWDVINNLLVPSIVKANGNLAMLKLNNNLN
ncbi:DUF2479 domain-containing protein, partial [Clostridium perfringens]|uniref:DUF2479 domain-containing protein n=1 Tax=Clostridium perfringens TaxID=1502 RepID=UPI0028E0B53D